MRAVPITVRYHYDRNPLMSEAGKEYAQPGTIGDILDGAATVILKTLVNNVKGGYMRPPQYAAHIDLFINDRSKIEAVAFLLERTAGKADRISISGKEISSYNEIKSTLDSELAVPTIFLCHNTSDKPFVRKLAQRLGQAGAHVWVDEAEINVGDSLTEKIGSAIEHADYLGAVLSQKAINSSWVQRELAIAIQKELKEKHVVVLPFLLEQVALPAFLSDKCYADFSDPDNFESSFIRVLKSLGLEENGIQENPNNQERTT